VAGTAIEATGAAPIDMDEEVVAEQTPELTVSETE
jgi:hypothetical protein